MHQLAAISIAAVIPLIRWPSGEDINKFVLEQFKAMFSSTGDMIDCTELFVETPSSLNIQSATYSSYKPHNTFMGLVEIGPTKACTTRK